MQKGKIVKVVATVFKLVYLTIITVSLSSVIYALFAGLVSTVK